MSLNEISTAYMIWRSFVRSAKMFPHDQELGRQACLAQKNLVIIQAIYFAGVKS